MLAIFLAFSSPLNPAYRFPEGKAVDYRVKIDFQGYLPLLGGQEGKAVADVTFHLVGRQAESGLQSASVDLTAFLVKFNNFKVPVTLKDAQKFYPTSSYSFSPSGVVQSSTAPKAGFPVRLPGLDIQRIPEISFLPLVFPEGGVEVGKTYEFSKDFGGSVAKYRVTPIKTLGSEVDFEIKFSQSYTDLEDEADQVVTNKADAVTRVETNVVGRGQGAFDMELGRFKRFSLKDDARSRATDLATGKAKSRTLHRILVIESR